MCTVCVLRSLTLIVQYVCWDYWNNFCVHYVCWYYVQQCIFQNMVAWHHLRKHFTHSQILIKYRFMLLNQRSWYTYRCMLFNQSCWYKYRFILLKPKLLMHIQIYVLNQICCYKYRFILLNQSWRSNENRYLFDFMVMEPLSLLLNVIILNHKG